MQVIKTHIITVAILQIKQLGFSITNVAKAMSVHEVKSSNEWRIMDLACASELGYLLDKATFRVLYVGNTNAKCKMS